MSQIIKYADADTVAYLQKDRILSPPKLQQKIANQEIVVALEEDKCVGWLRYNFFWDIIPFLNMIYIDEAHRGLGYGSGLLLFWETEMKKQEHTKLMSSSQSDEKGQHFFRKRGYRDIGSLLLPEEPLEIFFIKEL